VSLLAAFVFLNIVLNIIHPVDCVVYIGGCATVCYVVFQQRKHMVPIEINSAHSKKNSLILCGAT